MPGTLARCFSILYLAIPLGALASAPTDPPSYSHHLPTLENSAEIVIDAWGVPHVRAQSERDSWVTVGFTQARDRFFQMDYTRRLVGGTRAEILGTSYVDDDHDMRTLGLPWAAEQMWNGIEEDDREILEAYAQGVNAYIAALQAKHPGLVFPPEYDDLGVTAQMLAPWEPVHSIQVISGFIFGLTQAIEADLARTAITLTYPRNVIYDVLRFAPADTVPALYPGEYAEHLRPNGPLPGDDGFQSPMLGPGPLGSDFHGLPDAVDAALALWNRVIDSAPWLDTDGSNAWAADASRTETGRSIFSSDNHVGTPLPPVYHEVHLTTPNAGLNVYGLMTPGAPIFANGFNDNAAWGYTVLPMDGTDLFWERLPLPNKVAFMGRLVDIEVRHETYYALVDGELVDRTDLIEEPITRFVPHHGPILATALFGRRALTYRWVGFEPSVFVEPLMRRMRSVDVEDAVDASQDIDVFGANMIVADVYGDIGYTVTGTFPIRPFKNIYRPFWPRLGGGLWEWRNRLEPVDYVSSIAPDRGFIATSNNDPVGYSFDNRLTNDPVYYAIGHDPGFRQRRIHKGILDRTPLSIEDMMEIQFDVHVAMAPRLIPHLRIAADARPDLVSEAAADAIDRLEAWDTRAVRSSHEVSIFHHWWIQLVEDTYNDIIDPGLMYHELFVNSLLHLVEYPERVRTGEALWDRVDTPVVETREDILLGALDTTLDYLASRFGTSDPSQWLWGDIHTKRMGHPLGGEYNYPPNSQPARPYDAGDFTVNPMASGFRLVADMNPDGIEAWMVLPGGNSGIPGSAHYTDQAEMYFEGDYRKVRLDAAEVDDEAGEVWFLTPFVSPETAPPADY